MIFPIERNNFKGVEAVEIYRLIEDYPDVFNVVKNILALSYRIQLGYRGEQFIKESFKALEKINSRDKLETICTIFEQRRKVFKELQLFNSFHKYKEGSLLRSIKIVGEHNLKGTILDVGSNDNRLGNLILKTCCNVSEVIGVDIENRSAQTDSDRLRFFQQKDPSKLPFENEVVDVVIMRFSLHHMTSEIQNSILLEAQRVLKHYGKIVIMEDSYSRTIQPICNNDVHAIFMELDSEKKQMLALSFLDASSCLVVEESMPFCFSYRKLEDWEAQLEKTGFDKVNTDYWGIPFFSLFQAPLGVLLYKKK
jgi:ubiquinone/menaquinone biosynthesis C-methylase UbiE